MVTAHVPLDITDQWDHAVHQGDVLVLQALHVSHDVGLRMIAGERTNRVSHFSISIKRVARQTG